jgi:hypothetical protein
MDSKNSNQKPEQKKAKVTENQPEVELQAEELEERIAPITLKPK